MTKLPRWRTGKRRPVLSPKERETLENEARAKKDLAKEKSEVEKAEALKKAEQETLKAAAAVDESTNVDVVLRDVKFPGPSYKAQFMKYIAGEKQAITDTKLVNVANWYLGGRDIGHWTVTEKPKSLYKSWTDKTLVKVDWPSYPNSEAKTWRGKTEPGIMSEFRSVTFQGYASYRLHPLAKKPPPT